MSERLAEADLLQPIPLEIPDHGDGKWKKIPLKTSGEQLVPLGLFSGHRPFCSSIYFGERVDSPYLGKPRKGSLVIQFVRQSVADKLDKAEGLLPDRYHLVVLDCFRPLEVQQSFFDNYYQQLQTVHPDWTSERLLEETQHFVSLPSTDPTKPSPHNTGGSVDLMIFQLSSDLQNQVDQINKEFSKPNLEWERVYQLETKRAAVMSQGKTLNFGAPFDWGGEQSTLNCFELLDRKRTLTSEETEALNSRRMLFNLMSHVGLLPFKYEFWHFNDPKSQMGAYTAGLDFAEYGPANWSKENEQKEKTMKGHWAGTCSLFRDQNNQAKVNLLWPYWKIVKASLAENGDPLHTTLSKASDMTPI